MVWSFGCLCVVLLAWMFSWVVVGCLLPLFCFVCVWMHSRINSVAILVSFAVWCGFKLLVLYLIGAALVCVVYVVVFSLIVDLWF